MKCTGRAFSNVEITGRNRVIADVICYDFGAFANYPVKRIREVASFECTPVAALKTSPLADKLLAAVPSRYRLEVVVD